MYDKKSTARCFNKVLNLTAILPRDGLQRYVKGRMRCPDKYLCSEVSVALKLEWTYEKRWKKDGITIYASFSASPAWIFDSFVGGWESKQLYVSLIMHSIIDVLMKFCDYMFVSKLELIFKNLSWMDFRFSRYFQKESLLDFNFEIPSWNSQSSK